MTRNREIWKPDLEAGDAGGRPKWILVEIVSALRVPSTDARSDADAFVTVSVGGEEVHRTKVLTNNRNPIWTIETGSLFLLELDDDDDDNEADLKTDTVTFVLKDYDTMQSAKMLGAVEVNLKDLIKGTGKRKEYSMDVPQGVLDLNKKWKRKVAKKAKLVLRFKPASVEELNFIETLKEKAAGVFASETYLKPSRSTAVSKDGTTQIGGWGAKLLGTATDDADVVLQEALEPSSEWIDVGSGREGRLFLEVIACNGLPNLDSPTLMNVNNLTDPYCCIVMEDSIVNTSIIKDTLSPRWMPNDRRAFVFHVQHPSSQVYVGVFDRDKVNRPGASMRQRVHDPIGRVVLNLTQFHPDTLYTLQYHLYLVDNESGKHREEQTHRGTITLRLRIEWGDKWCHGNEMKNMIVAGMLSPPPSYLSVPTIHDFRTAYYTTEGDHDASKFNMTTLTGYVEELQGYVEEDVIELILDASLTVLLWRGHYDIPCCGRIISLPLHSIVAFAWGLLVTQNYNRLLSFLLFAIGWFFLATMEYRCKHPSPWHKCKSYAELLGALLAGSCCGCYGTHDSQTIVANENLPAVQSYYAAITERKKNQAKQKELAVKDAAEADVEELTNEAEMDANIGMEVAIATAQKDSFLASMNPLKPILHPVQKILYDILVYMRVIKSFVTWEENYYSFWIVTISFIASLLTFFVRWGWILRWTVRLAIWVVLGPWMKIVDWVYFAGMEKMTPEEKKKVMQQELHDQYEQTLAERRLSQKRKEQAVKLKSMMKYFFGKFVLRVPRFREAQFLDYPLPASTAEPFREGAEFPIVGQICGQTLTGDMIPTRMRQVHPFITKAPSDSNSLAKVLADEAAEGETKPLLSYEKKKKKGYGLFKKRW